MNRIESAGARFVHFALHVRLVLLCLVLAPAVAPAQSNIDPSEKSAWSENAGWMDFRPNDAFGGVYVTPTYLYGTAWAENVGWMKLGAGVGPYANTAAGNYGVNRENVTGALSGYAWSESGGWIRFDPQCGGSPCGGVTLDGVTMRLDGYAWGENVGWIRFRGTTTQPPTTTYGVASVTLPVVLQGFQVD